MTPQAESTTVAVATRPLQRRDLAIAAAIFALTLALRLVYLLHAQDASWPHSVPYEGDAPVWARWAGLLADGQPFEADLPFRAPGVAYVLRWIGATAPPFTGAKMLWCVVSAATPAAIHLVMRRWFGSVAAAVAALGTMVGFGSFTLATTLNNEAPYALLVTTLVGVTIAWSRSPGLRTSMALGLLHGACLLLRPEHAMLLVMLGAWACTSAIRLERGWKLVTARAAIVGGVAVLACLPWMLRSHAAAERFNREAPPIAFEQARPPWTPSATARFRALPGFTQDANFRSLQDLARQQGLAAVDDRTVQEFFDRLWQTTPEPIAEWSLVSFKGPLDFALANDVRGDGGFSQAALADRLSPNPPFALERPSHLHLVNHGYAVGWKSITRDPARWLRLAKEKIARFTDGTTLGLFTTDWPHGRRHVRQAIDLAVPERGDAPAWNATMIALVVAGAVIALRTPGGGALLVVLAYRLLVVIAFYGYARHAASIAPILFAFSGLSMQRLVEQVMRQPRLRSHANLARVAGAVAAAALVIAAFVTAWRPPEWFAQPLARDGRITPTPQWHPDAFEAVDAIVLEPVRASDR